MPGISFNMKRFKRFYNLTVDYIRNNAAVVNKPCNARKYGDVSSYSSRIRRKYLKGLEQSKSLADVGRKREVKYVCSKGFLKAVAVKRGTIERELKDKISRDVNKANDIFVDNVNSFKLYTHSYRSSTRPQNFSRANDWCCEFNHQYHDVLSEFNDSIKDVNIEDAIVVKGCYRTNKVTLQKTATPEKNIKLPPYYDDLSDDMKEAIKRTITKMRIPILGSRTIDDIYNFTFNPEAGPGFHFKDILKNNTKRECVIENLRLAKERWDYIEKASRVGETVKRAELKPSIYTIGARNKKEIGYEEYEEGASRAVHMPEFHQEIVSAPWNDRITAYYTDIDQGPIYIGNSFLDFERFERDVNKCKYTIEGDWKSYDSTIYLPMICIAMSIYRLFFNDSARVDNHMLAIFDSVAIKDYYIPGASVIRLLHGIPSGIKSTSILGSIANLVALTFCTVDLPSKRLLYVVGGDDFIFGDRMNLSDNKIHKVIAEMQNRADILGMTFKILEKKEVFKNGRCENVDKLPMFYKYTIVDGKPIIKPEVIYERMLLPWNKRYNNSIRLLRFLKDLMPSLAAPSSACLIYYYFYARVYNYVFFNKHSNGKSFAFLSSGRKTPADIYKMHSRMYELIAERKYFRNKIKENSENKCLLSFKNFRTQVKVDKKRYKKVRAMFSNKFKIKSDISKILNDFYGQI